MDEPGQKLKRARERLNLRFRDVEEASAQIAERRGNEEFGIALSRLSDIENKGTVPSIFKVYALSTIYRLDPHEVLEWYGVKLADQAADAANILLPRTHLIGLSPNLSTQVDVPLSLDPGIDLAQTNFLSPLIQRWGKLPLALFSGVAARAHRYGYIGTDDWSMYPLLQPGALVLIDDSQRKILNSGWSNEFERPIYFMEHRNGYTCGWCILTEDVVMMQPHPASMCVPQVFRYPNEIEVVGRVTGVAMLLDQGARRGTRPATTP